MGQLINHDFLFPSEIAEMIYCDRPTASVIIRNMEKQGWVKTEKDQQNRKRKKVFLTPLGKKKRLTIPDSLHKVDMTAFDPLGCLSKEEVQTFGLLIMKIKSHCNQLNK